MWDFIVLAKLSSSTLYNYIKRTNFHTAFSYSTHSIVLYTPMVDIFSGQIPSQY